MNMMNYDGPCADCDVLFVSFYPACLARRAVAYGVALLSQVALHSVTLRHARINATVAGEAQPRVFDVSDTLVQLGRGYHTVDASLTALAHERDPAADKCTMISETFQRHLRRNAGHQAPIVKLPTPGQADENRVGSLAAGLPSPSGRPTGGRLRIKLGIRHLMTPGATPDLRVWHSETPVPVSLSVLFSHKQADPRKLLTPQIRSRPDTTDQEHVHSAWVWCLQLDVVGSNIHAPLVERLIELPMDISGGRLDGDFHLRSHDAATWHFPAIDGRIRQGWQNRSLMVHGRYIFLLLSP